MSTRSRSLVPVLVLAGAVLLAAARPLVVFATLRTEPAMAAPPREHSPARRPPSRAAPRIAPEGVRVARVALREIGAPYVWGGESPRGFDCSGLVRYAYLRVGISLPHSSYALSTIGRRVGRSHLEPGDLLFYDGDGHVGIYVGNRRMVHAPQTGRSVEIVSVSGGYGSRFLAARRVVRG